MAPLAATSASYLAPATAALRTPHLILRTSNVVFRAPSGIADDTDSTCASQASLRRCHSLACSLDDFVRAGKEKGRHLDTELLRHTIVDD